MNRLMLKYTIFDEVNILELDICFFSPCDNIFKTRDFIHHENHPN